MKMIIVSQAKSPLYVGSKSLLARNRLEVTLPRVLLTPFSDKHDPKPCNRDVWTSRFCSCPHSCAEHMVNFGHLGIRSRVVNTLPNTRNTMAKCLSILLLHVTHGVS